MICKKIFYYKVMNLLKANNRDTKRFVVDAVVAGIHCIVTRGFFSCSVGAPEFYTLPVDGIEEAVVRLVSLGREEPATAVLDSEDVVGMFE